MLYNVLFRVFHSIYHAVSSDWDQLTLFQSQTGTKSSKCSQHGGL